MRGSDHSPVPMTSQARELLPAPSYIAARARKPRAAAESSSKRRVRYRGSAAALAFWSSTVGRVQVSLAPQTARPGPEAIACPGSNEREIGVTAGEAVDAVAPVPVAAAACVGVGAVAELPYVRSYEGATVIRSSTASVNRPARKSRTPPSSSPQQVPFVSFLRRQVLRRPYELGNVVGWTGCG